jgi:hypothetical protein
MSWSADHHSIIESGTSVLTLIIISLVIVENSLRLAIKLGTSQVIEVKLSLTQS